MICSILFTVNHVIYHSVYYCSKISPVWVKSREYPMNSKKENRLLLVWLRPIRSNHKELIFIESFLESFDITWSHWVHIISVPKVVTTSCVVWRLLFRVSPYAGILLPEQSWLFLSIFSPQLGVICSCGINFNMIHSKILNTFTKLSW